MKINRHMKIGSNPFLHNDGNPEGSEREKFFVRHALRREHSDVPDDEYAVWRHITRLINLPETGASASATVPGGRSRDFRLLIRVLLGAAASVALLVGVALFYASSRPADNSTVELYIAGHGGPGDIIMTFPGGVEKIIDNRLALDISRSAVSDVGSMPGTVSIATPAGKELSVILPDSTRIWLWPNSRLEFPEYFTDGKREISLRGEAYLQVSSKDRTPFIVRTPYFTTMVYGTGFGIRAADGADASVTLVEGALSVRTGRGDSGEVMLRPSQEAVVSPDGKVSVRDVDTYPLRQWRDGLFYFEHESLHNILLTLGRWHNVTVEVADGIDLDEPYHFVADRRNPLSAVVGAFAAVSEMEIDFDGARISVAAPHAARRQ